ncbi:hypothetical protein CTI12_AA505090 [Artemisia annua]|uniref:Uncharacterized protein n=1 Tax=Artemisia annua TaxID=35608 RepID=A0A2U1LCT7_ARTAN|nr:hypothetical protein CTI12_AA505090 [Artemisia annua]
MAELRWQKYDGTYSEIFVTHVFPKEIAVKIATARCDSNATIRGLRKMRYETFVTHKIQKETLSNFRLTIRDFKIANLFSISRIQIRVSYYLQPRICCENYHNHLSYHKIPK